ncbi:hypothetical protein [Nonomuraea sp. NPDC003804]|uniref:hypothetical protein n=1 Tax=Nonomuraea sp. NPDC003804 TaxID=3154547 RepID=UPI0033A6098A
MRIWRIALLPALLLSLGLSSAHPAQAADVETKVLVALRKQGGFAGFDDRVTVYTNGCVRLSRRTGPTVDKCLTKKEVAALRGHLKHLRLGRSEAQPQGADFIKYTISYKGHRASRYTLTTSWSPVVRNLEQLLERYWAPD